MAGKGEIIELDDNLNPIQSKSEVIELDDNLEPIAAPQETKAEPPTEPAVELPPITLDDSSKQVTLESNTIPVINEEDVLLRDKYNKESQQAANLESGFTGKQQSIRDKEKTLDWKKRVANYLERIIGQEPPPQEGMAATEVVDDPTPIDINAPIELDRQMYGINPETGFPTLPDNIDPELRRRVLMKATREFDKAKKDFEQIKPVLESIKTVGQAKRAMGWIGKDLDDAALDISKQQFELDADYKKVRELNKDKLRELGAWESFEDGISQTTKANDVADTLLTGDDYELSKMLEEQYTKNVLYGDREVSEVSQMLGGQVKPLGVVFTSALLSGGSPLAAGAAGTAYYGRMGAGSEAIQAYIEARSQGMSSREALEVTKNQAVSGGLAGAAEGLVGSTMPVAKAIKPLLKFSKPMANAIVAGAADLGTDAAVAMGAQGYKNYAANENGLVRDLSEGVADEGIAEAAFSLGFQILFHGAGKISSANYNQLLTDYARHPLETIQFAVDDAVKNGTLDFAQAEKVMGDLTETKAALDKIPKDVPDDKVAEVVPVVKEITRLEEENKTVVDGLKGINKKKIEKLNEDLKQQFEPTISEPKTETNEESNTASLPLEKSEESVLRTEEPEVELQGVGEVNTEQEPTREISATEEKAQITPQEIHELAKEKGIDVDSQDFKDKSKELTGESHLDSMNPEQLETVKSDIVTGKELEPHKEVKANKTIALKEVAGQHGLKEMEGAMLHGLKGKTSQEIQDIIDGEGMKTSVVKKLEEKGFIEADDSDSYMPILSQKAKDFIEAVDARIETRKGVKLGYDLFPELANIPEFKPIQKELQKHIDDGNTTNEAVERFGKRTADEVEKSESVVAAVESKANSDNEAELNEAIAEADKLIEPVAEITPSQKARQTTKDFLKKFGSVDDPTVKKLGGGIDEIVDAVFDAYDASIKAGKEIKEAIEDAVKHFKESDFYKGLKEEDKTEAEDFIRGQVEEKSSDTGVSHERTDKLAKEFGLEEYEASPETIAEWDKEADRRLREEPNTIADLIEKLESGREADKIDQRIMFRHLASLGARIRDNPSDTLIAEYKKAKELSDIQGGREVAKSLSARRGAVPVEDTLVDMLVAKMESTGVEKLTDAQKAEVQKQFDAIQKSKEEADAKIAVLEEKLRQIEARKEITKIINEVKKQKRVVTREVLKKERDVLFDELRKTLAPKGTLALPVESIPVIAKIARNYVQDGITRVEDIVDKIHLEIGEQFDKREIRDAISGYNQAKKQRTLNELTSQVRDIKEEMKLLSQLEDLESGIEPKTEKKKVERNQKIKDLRDQIKSLKKEEGMGQYSDLAKIKSAKSRADSRRKLLEKQIEDGDFTTETRVPLLENRELQKAHPKEYKEALDAIVAKEDAKHDWDIAMMNDQLAKRSTGRKVFDFGRGLLSTSKAIVSGIDDSFAMIQGGMAIMANPRSGTIALKEHALDALSKKRFDRQLAAIHNSEAWDLIKKSGLDILEPKSLKAEKKEEVFDNNLLNTTFKIKGKEFNIGSFTTAPFERAFTSLGNNLRLNIFLRKADDLYSRGKTFESHPQEFKDAAEVVNTMTGRGTVHRVFDNEMVKTVIWSPKLLASGLNLLGVGDVGNVVTGKKGYYAKMTPEGRKFAVSQAVKGFGMGIGLMAAAAAGGAEVDDDPRSVTFGTVKFSPDGNSYSIFGRFTPVVRLIAMLATGEKVINGEVRELDKQWGGISRAGELWKFFRGKLNPASGVAVDAITQKRFDGSPFTVSQAAQDLTTPLSIKELMKGIKQDGSAAILKRGIPSFVGIKVSNEKDFEKKENKTIVRF